MSDEQEDICGFCGEPGANKIPHPHRWPTEVNPNSELVHADCEQEECHRAHAEFRDRVGLDGIRRFLRTI